MEAKQDAQLLEASWSKQSRWQFDFVLVEVQHDPLHTFHILGVFIVISFISLLDLFCLFISMYILE